mmetsp:Transcript_26469/g.39157  ORF Transcript_26469/g.39157 Transcript_26469/m.39157 type:complete len:134 (+) Transcript_26469:74-475(+)|eukprot:CAMPEP_0194200068 /NCGR_PEP_ID=MMETSP0156-20130528/842_1 /TAXON_ID=33649 /ORGANISM="Thalassionema nitzschioides, Strain L26-B" /LENGTH=133 /DNA_ID=CAMNT_0038925035 /DNA_START=45 /DNA_END=446 /DNA_ORIENTATION=+
MGGGNAQKSAAARERKNKDQGKTPEERAIAKAKAAKDKDGFKCKICMTTFMINVKPPTLYLHMTSKHKDTTDPYLCFDSMKDYDPEDPEGKKAAAAAAATKVVIKKKPKKQPEIDDLLSAGLNNGKKKGKGKK